MRLRILFSLVVLAVGLAGCGPAKAGRRPPAPTTTAPATPSAHAAPSRAPSPTATAQPCAGSAPWAGEWSKQMKAAGVYACRQPGALGIVVRDRRTGAVWQAGAADTAMYLNSSIKLAMAVGLLQRHRNGQIRLNTTDRQRIVDMLSWSSNEAADALWTKFGGPAQVELWRSFGLKSLSWPAGAAHSWGNLRATASDLTLLMTHALDRLHPEDSKNLVVDLIAIHPGTKWGVWAAGSRNRPGNKNGWAPRPDENGVSRWTVSSVGFAGAGQRYAVAVIYHAPAGVGMHKSVSASSDLVATVFGATTPFPVPALPTN